MWPPAFTDFYLQDIDMPLLFGGYSLREVGDIEAYESALTEDSHTRNKEQHGGSRLHVEHEKGGGEDESEVFSRSESVLSKCHVPHGIESSAHSAFKEGAGLESLQHFNSISSHNITSCQPAGNSSFASSSTTLMDKHSIIAQGQSLPPKRYDRVLRNARYTFLSVYRRLHLLVLLPNIIAMVVLGALNAPGVLRLPISTVATASAANIACAVVMRQELVINALFILFGHCPRWFPLRIRRLSAKIYHLGGVHSGAGVAATIWFGLTNVATFSMNPEAASGGTLIALWTITIALDILLLSILLMALPAFRVRWHDCWEWSHRFCGWAAIGLFWALFLLISITAKRTMSPEPHLWRVIVVSPVFWLLVLITICLIAPWLNLRKVPVRSEKLSNHAVRLHFTYANVPLCSAPRLTDKPLREWHAFASIPEESGKGFSVLVSKAGNWTGAIIENPPSYLWKRGWLTRGVLNVAPIFKSMVLVATGSGIGPVLSLLQAKRKLGFIRLLWSTKDPIKTYGQRVMDNVMAADPNAVIINTSVDRRPNLLELAHGMYVDSQAEAVFVISNPRVTRKTVYGLESRGVPTFAPIFDS